MKMFIDPMYIKNTTIHYSFYKYINISKPNYVYKHFTSFHYSVICYIEIINIF